jgi:hypothetical protein
MHVELDRSEVEEANPLLAWLDDGHFPFLGSRDYDLVTEDGEERLRRVVGSGRGILRRRAGRLAGLRQAAGARARARPRAAPAQPDQGERARHRAPPVTTSRSCPEPGGGDVGGRLTAGLARAATASPGEYRQHAREAGRGRATRPPRRAVRLPLDRGAGAQDSRRDVDLPRPGALTLEARRACGHQAAASLSNAARLRLSSRRSPSSSARFSARSNSERCRWRSISGNSLVRPAG